MTILAAMPDISVLLLWGLVATVVMTVILYGSQVAGLSRLSLPFLFGTWITSQRDRAHVYGFLAYLFGGWVFAGIYAALFTQVGTSWWIGAIAGFVHGLALLTIMLPTFPYIHPRMASEYDGPTERRRLEPPGFLGLNYGHSTPLTTMLAQIAYGAILGGTLPG